MALEEIGYSIVGEETKLPSNVIGYNIREEQTKDTFAIDNANNQTTTGMANVIPGVNTPKLFASTSIIGGGGNVSYCKISMNISATVSAGNYGDFDVLTIDEASPDVSLNASYPKRIYLTDGIYIMTVMMHPHNGNINYSYSAGLWQSGNGEDIMKFKGTSGQTQSSTIVFKTTNGYLTNGFNTDYNATNMSDTYMILVKIG